MGINMKQKQNERKVKQGKGTRRERHSLTLSPNPQLFSCNAFLAPSQTS